MAGLLIQPGSDCQRLSARKGHPSLTFMSPVVLRVWLRIELSSPILSSVPTYWLLCQIFKELFSLKSWKELQPIPSLLNHRRAVKEKQICGVKVPLHNIFRSFFSILVALGAACCDYLFKRLQWDAIKEPM